MMDLKQLTALIHTLPARLFNGQTIAGVEFMPGGNTSLVYKLTSTDGGSFILKMTGDALHLRAEAAFLDAWRQAGLRTPNVYHFGCLNNDDYISAAGGRLSAVVFSEEKPFLILEFVEGQNLLGLLEAGRLPADKILSDLGLLLARMHTVKAQGFGRVIFQGNTFRGEHDNFQAEMAAGEFQAELQINLQQGRLREADLNTINTAIDIVHKHAEIIGPSLVHTDFRAGNILYHANSAQPYTIIDPSPRITHPYLCLAYALTLEKIHARRNPGSLFAGYTKITVVEPLVLTAAILLTSTSLLSRWGDETHPYANNLLHLYKETQDKLNKRRR